MDVKVKTKKRLLESNLFNNWNAYLELQQEAANNKTKCYRSRYRNDPRDKEWVVKYKVTNTGGTCVIHFNGCQ